MAENSEFVSPEILDELKILEKKYAKTTYLTFTEIGELLEKKPSVIAQYAKAGLIHPIQQGPKKLVRLDEVYFLEVCMRAVKYYGCSYVACKIFGGLLRQLDVSPQQYMNLIKKLEDELLAPDEVLKNVNSYTNRGIYQKKKNSKSAEDI